MVNNLRIWRELITETAIACGAVLTEEQIDYIARSVFDEHEYLWELENNSCDGLRQH